jgi:dipeptidyl aminopeptidase/acylaminoacyl peptidase
MRPNDLRRRLRDAPIPDEHGARERGWRVVRAGFEERRPDRHGARNTSRVAIALATTALALALVLTPAGAKVVDLVRDVVEPGAKHARPLTSLPAPGELLVNSAQGPWVFDPDGSQRLLGDYRDATWSPTGLYVAVTREDQLSAVEPDGTVRWSLNRTDPTNPRWAPSGYRIAYRTGKSMRVVHGDRMRDHLLVRRVAPTAAAWQPLPPVLPSGLETTDPRANVLALAKPDGRVEVIDAGGRVHGVSPPGPVPTELDWSADGSLLVAVSGSILRVFDGDAQVVDTRRLPAGIDATSGAFAPSGSTFAITGSSNGRRGTRSIALTLDVGSSSGRVSRLFAGVGRFSGLSWSPNGAWLLVGWRDADEWLFLRPQQAGHRSKPEHVKTAGHVSRQFSPGSTGASAFPRPVGWCCTASGAS